MAIKAATRKVLSPISETRIMLMARMYEWKGWMTAAPFESSKSSDSSEEGYLADGSVPSDLDDPFGKG